MTLPMTQDYTALEAELRKRADSRASEHFPPRTFMEWKAADAIATLRARLEAVEGALREAREFIAETKNNPRDDGKIVEIIGRIDAALQEPQT